MLDKYAETRDTRFLSRVLRHTRFLVRHLPDLQLQGAVDTYVPEGGRAAVRALVTTATATRKVSACHGPG